MRRREERKGGGENRREEGRKEEEVRGGEEEGRGEGGNTWEEKGRGEGSEEEEEREGRGRGERRYMEPRGRESKMSCVQLRDRALTRHVKGPGFVSQHCRKQQQNSLDSRVGGICRVLSILQCVAVAISFFLTITSQ